MDLSIYPICLPNYVSTYLPIYLPIYLSVCLSVCLFIYLPVYLEAWKPSYSGRCLHFSKLTTSKTKQFCETSSMFELNNLRDGATLRDLFIFQSWHPQKRSKPARRPQFLHLATSKSKQFNYVSIYLPIYLPFYLPIYVSIYLSVCLSVYLPVYLQAWKPNYSARLLHFSKLTTSKTQQFCVTSSFFKVDNFKKRSNSARLLHFSMLTTSKTKQFCETSSISKLENIQNEAILRDFLQKWKVECSADGLVPMRCAIFPLHLSKVLCLPRKKDARSYEVLHLSRRIILGNRHIWCSKMIPVCISAEKLCPLNRLQTQPYTTKWRLNLNQPPCYKMSWGFLWWIKSQCRSLQNDFTYPFCSENGLQWKIMILY